MVHGDLRLANIIFAKENPCSLLLVDFDWEGGRQRPTSLVAELLKSCVYRVIRTVTKEDDGRVLARTFKLPNHFTGLRGWTDKEMNSIGKT